jgi:hypothetical protein
MKKTLLPILLILFFTTCLEPPRENKHDPYNQAYLAGTAYDYNQDPLEGARVKLKNEYDHEIEYETVTNSSGWYEFPQVISRDYTVIAEAEYYTTLYIQDVCIEPSSHTDDYDLYFDELHFDFDNEALGTQEPFGFATLFGTWQVQEDPDAHSAPNVYNALHTASSAPFALSVFRDTVEDFWFSAKIKVLSGSSTWNAGLALRYQDENNYYRVQFMSNGLSLVKIQNGNPIQLAIADTYTFAPHNWYHVSAYVHDTHITVYLDYTELFEINDNASPFYMGAAGLWIYNSEPTGSATANFDDVYIAP